ncbi:ImmA/IrrE family metallo-endopeptidase [Sorangium sp. So ce363]|uniref:ImmA/IrrE family metallo-endopeptidase n=1 Tax=Sorangium sp. So ce363 TaxID=3133304 RepID=UPI003F62599F
MASVLRRGFKSEANELAREMRRELGVQLHEPLDPWRLADVLGIPVMRLSELREDVPEHVDYLLRVEAGAFSAVTVFRGRRRTIVHNDQHASGRQANNVAHELSHAVLQHEPAPALSIVGCRDWDPVLEEEATWLSAALLVSDEAALHIVRAGLSLADAAAQYGVSEQLVRWRVNITGARRRAAAPPVAKTGGPADEVRLNGRRVG